MRLHCLQHVEFETPGHIVDWAGERQHSLHYTRFFREEALPVPEDFDALVIMGGPMSIHDEREFSWLRAEKELIGEAMRQRKKILGICLGAQLIAASAGARVYPNPQKEIGFFPLQWTAEAREWWGVSGGDAGAAGVMAEDAAGVMEGREMAPARPGEEVAREGRDGELLTGGGAPVFHWHGETFDLPAGAVRLAFSDACVNQGFLLGETVMGLQFHLEVTPVILQDMIAHEGHELVAAPYIQSADTIRRQTALLSANNRLLSGLLDRFFQF